MSSVRTKPRICKCGAQITYTAGLCRTRCMACRMARQGKQVARRELPALPPYSLTRTVGAGVTRTLPAKPVTHRSRALLDLAHDVHECQSCGKHVAHGCEPAHANLSVLEKGMGTKAHDWAHAALCHECHVWLDSGSRARDEKRVMWTAAHFKTMALYWRSGWLAVTP